MIVAIYKDDGPLHGGGQDLGRTSTWEKAIPFSDYEAFRSADSLISEDTARRKNPRYIKWYEVEGAIPRAEVAALRAQLHTEAEQRQFVSNLIDNMPHAQIAAELAAFKAEVAAALEKLRAEYEDCPLLGQEFAIEMLDATITALGLTAEAFDALITSQPDVLEKLADEALEGAK